MDARVYVQLPGGPACHACRKGKRRCDRQFPKCNLCERKGLVCEYPRGRTANDRGTGTHSGLTSDRSLIPLEGESDSTGRSLASSPSVREDLSTYSQRAPKLVHDFDHDANAIYFIAPHLFKVARLEFASMKIETPGEVLTAVGDVQNIRKVAANFFLVIHRWLPVLSKRSFYDHLCNPLARRGVELHLLAACMKLCCTTPDPTFRNSDARTPLYRLVKQFHREVEEDGLLSLHVLQAHLLIAFYEMSHAIYPAAYLSVGACARYGLALGIDKTCLTQPYGGNERSGFIEWEERRRSWWAILLFDRMLSINDPYRSLSTEDPTFETFLPVDDAAFDNGTASPEDAVTIATGFTLNMGSFARLAQATFLLSQALHVITSHKSYQPGGVDETEQLRRTLMALVNAADNEASIRRLEFCAQSALSLNTILLLQDHRLKQYNEEKPIERSDAADRLIYDEARVAIDRLSASAKSCVETVDAGLESPDYIPICAIHVTFQVPSVLLRQAESTRDMAVCKNLEPFKRLLQMMKARWHLAGVYLGILEAQEFSLFAHKIDTQESVHRFPYGAVV